jgi:hypothetical protein
MIPHWTQPSISLTRREWLKLLLVLSAWLPARLVMSAAGDPSSVQPAALGPFLDTLLPAGDSPSATDLKVDKAIFSQAMGNRDLMRLVGVGCEWLDREARKNKTDSFALLDETARTRFVSQMESSPNRSLPKVFFQSLRDLAFRYYYTQPESWAGLGYQGPPQPLGFPGHDMAPKNQS